MVAIFLKVPPYLKGSNPNTFPNETLNITGLSTNASGNLLVYAQNGGTATVSFNSSNCVYVNGELQNCTILQNNPLPVGQTAEISVAYVVQLNDSITVKVLTNTGVSAQTTKIFTQSSEQNFQITIASTPSGAGFVKVDGAIVTTPITEVWATGSIHQLEALSPISGPSGVQYAWAEWSDSGSQVHNYTVPDSSQTVTAIYNTQYHVTFSVNSTEGLVNPSSSNWYNAAAVVPISTTAKSGYSFTSWTESGSIAISDTSSSSTDATINGPGTVVANLAISSANPSSQPSPTTPSTTPSPTTPTNTPSPTSPPTTPSPTAAPVVSITISSNPSGSGFLQVDGVMQVTPYVASWSVGSTHTLQALSDVENGNGVQYVWTSWSNGAAQTNTYTVPSSNAAIAANYETQYLFTVMTNGLPSSNTTAISVGVQQVGSANDVTPFREWLDASSTTGTVGVSSLISGGNGIQYVFTNWTPGNSAANPRSSMTINSPLTITANYITQYQVTFNSNPSTAGTTVPGTGTGWFNASNPLSISATAVGYDQFGLWTTTGNITINSPTANPTTATLNGPGTITANYQSTIAYITINSTPPDLPDIMINESSFNLQTFRMIIGDDYTLEAISPYPMGTGIQYSFSSWSNGAPQTQDYIPSSNATLTVNYNVQYQLTMANNYGTVNPPSGSWYSPGSSVTINAVSPNVGAGERYVWNGWTGSGNGSYTDTSTGNNAALVTMNGPITETASWTHQYQQTLSYTVVDGGSPSAPTATGTSLGVAYAPSLTTTGTPYWFDASGSITISAPTGSNEQWAPSPASILANQTNTKVVSMYNQYKQFLSYTVVDGGSPSAPTATGTSLGVAYAPSLTTTGTPYWFDASGSITINTPTSGSTERWSPIPSSISATQSNTQVVSMYNQYQITANYSTSDSSVPSSSITLSGTQFGSSSYSLALATSAQVIWLDAGTGWSVNNPATSGTQRWDAASGTSGTVSSAAAVAPLYYHQYLQTLSYQVVDGGSPSSPTATGTSLGSVYAPSLTTSATGYWFDASGSIAISTSTGTNEHWVPSPLSISATSAHTQVVSMYNQFTQTLSYFVVDGGSPSAPTASGTSLGFCICAFFDDFCDWLLV